MGRIPKKKKGKTFSIKEKIEALKLVELYGNMSRVARETGVTRQTLMNWQKDPQLQPQYHVSPGRIEKRVHAKIERDEARFLEEVYNVKEKALNRMEVLIEKSTSLKDVTNAFAILQQVRAGDDPTDPRVSPNINITQNNFINKIKQLREGQTPNKPKIIKVEPND
jgi:transposase-like protein